MTEYRKQAELANTDQELQSKINLLLDSAKDNPEKLFHISNELVKLAIPELAKDYQLEQDEINENLRFPETKLYPILKAFSDHDIRGKVIVDLGCGSVGDSYESREYKRHFEPWLCRLLQKLGAKPIGIDIGKLDDELFEHYSLNLAKPGSLEVLQDESADMVFVAALYDSPELQKHVRSLRENAADQIKPILLPQIKRILKERGIFLEWEPSEKDQKAYKKEEI